VDLSGKLSEFLVYENYHRVHRTLNECKSAGILTEAEEGRSKILNQSD